MYQDGAAARFQGENSLRNKLKEILLEKSVISGREFKLASGKTSDFYVDARVTTLWPEGAYLCGKIFLEMLQDFKVDAVGGYSIGADPIVSAIAVLSFMDNKPIPAFIIRKEEKSHGTGKVIEGNFPAGGRVAIFDDVVTSGGSILRGAKQVEAQGGTVEVIMGVIDREDGGREKIEAAGYKFLSIFTRKDLL
ncbi:MAG: orotate phosphoribosyltransferase [Candidatus Aminicenantes bacterium]|nr:orotate phosphoribosyltransferase [Candidatus Aminicenantes bacterium]